MLPGFNSFEEPIYIPITSAQGFPFLPFLPALAVSCLADDSNSVRCKVSAHSGFGVHFPLTSDAEPLGVLLPNQTSAQVPFFTCIVWIFAFVL